MKMYVGNLPFTTTESDLRDLFSAHGEVTSVAVVTDRETMRPRGFAFVEMANSGEAQAAMSALNGKEFQGRDLTVNEAKPKTGGGGGGFGGGGRRGGGGGGRDRGGRGGW